MYLLVLFQLQFVWECARWFNWFRPSVWGTVSSLLYAQLAQLLAKSICSTSGGGGALSSFGSLAQQGQSGVGFGQQVSSAGFGGSSSSQG